MSLGTPLAKIPQTGFVEAILWRLGRRQLVVVQGDSMEPYISAGDEPLVAPARKPSVKTIVLAHHPTKPNVLLIKLVDRVRNGEFYLTGINKSASSDSRDFGWLANEQLVGRITSRVS